MSNVNPFDLKSALLAKHAQHVVLVHFPIALFLTGVFFDIAARWIKSATVAATARLNLLVAGVLVVPTIATGIVAWQWQLAGQKPKGVLLLHIALASASGLLICLCAWIQYRRHRTSPSPLPASYLALELLAAMVVALTAHLGGFLSGVNGPS